MSIARDHRPWQCAEVKGLRRQAGKNRGGNYDTTDLAANQIRHPPWLKYKLLKIRTLIFTRPTPSDSDIIERLATQCARAARHGLVAVPRMYTVRAFHMQRRILGVQNFRVSESEMNEQRDLAEF